MIVTFIYFKFSILNLKFLYSYGFSTPYKKHKHYSTNRSTNKITNIVPVYIYLLTAPWMPLKTLRKPNVQSRVTLTYPLLEYKETCILKCSDNSKKHK